MQSTGGNILKHFMKKIAPSFVTLTVFSLFLVACFKDPVSSNPLKPTLLLSKSSVKIGERLYATTSGTVVNSTVQWSNGTNQRLWTNSSSDSATYIFTNPGTYQITANFLSESTVVDSSTATVVVQDSIFSDTSTMHCDVVVVKTLSPDEQINLTPIDYSDTGLVFVAYTQTAYNHSPMLDCGGLISQSNGTFECDINSTLIFPCFGAVSPAPAMGIISFTSLTNGTYNLAFKLNGTLYQGSLTATDDQVVINWSHTSGVVISPLSIKKQFH
jgi:hypothetical protein